MQKCTCVGIGCFNYPDNLPQSLIKRFEFTQITCRQVPTRVLLKVLSYIYDFLVQNWAQQNYPERIRQDRSS